MEENVKVTMYISQEAKESIKFLQESFKKKSSGVKLSQGQVVTLVIGEYCRMLKEGGVKVE
ncbi:MAG: hypothetical protein H9W80_12910 [Enterococcus sp.]|nr:hypothetical protein [Enterococcus sp.]